MESIYETSGLAGYRIKPLGLLENYCVRGRYAGRKSMSLSIGSRATFRIINENDYYYNDLGAWLRTQEIFPAS